MRKIAVAEASGLIWSTLLFAELPDLRREITLPSRTREVRTTEDARLKFAYLVLRYVRRPNITLPDYLPNLLGSLDRDGNADSNRSGGGHIVPGNFDGKAACYTELIVAWVA